MFQESNRAKRVSKLYSAVCEHRHGAGIIDPRHQNLEIRPWSGRPVFLAVDIANL